ncbi:MAG: HAMP domain-containing sensor histidine kinase [Hespellia sp.]|nr:HAMP domain-containing sensor histidine kinase [Hespellia sp.]
MNRWYRRRGVKGFWMLAGHIALIFLCVCAELIGSISGDFYIGSMKDWKELSKQDYAESSAFADEVYWDSVHIINNLKIKNGVETDGAYDAKKLVDIESFLQDGTITGKNDSGFAYTIGDLYEWGKTLDEQGTDVYNEDASVVVCQKPDDTYHYYTMAEFRALISDGSLMFVGNEVYSNDILESLSEGYDSSYYSSDGVTINDNSGKQLYKDFWSIDTVVDEKYAPDGASSILEIANENPAWNGKLTDMYGYIDAATSGIFSKMDSYMNGKKTYVEGNTNLAYIFVDKDTKKVYTNRKAFASYDKVDASVDAIRNMGKYVVVMPKLEDFDTNMATSANDWFNLHDGWDLTQFEQLTEGDYIYAAAVDTAYPIQDAFYQANQNYQSYAPYFKTFLGFALLAVIVFFIALIWLTVTAGRVAEDDELHLYRFDEIWTGVGLLASCCMWLPGYLSIVRRIKAGNLWKKSILRKLCLALKEFWMNRRLVWKAGLAVFGLFFLHWITFGSGGSGIMILLMLAAEIAAFLWVIRLMVAKERIMRGIKEIANGNVAYEIPLGKLKGDNLSMAEAVNHIADGLQNAVEKSMKDERLKTDLITNVSHDIKTPLTSIINYVDLLKRENIQDPKIQGYIEILEAKAQRLKQLTEDVVEASKVSSGNVTLECMDINLVEMVQQIDGEFIEKLEARRLTMINNIPEDAVIIYVDGRRMSRILENIYGNACKYAMEGTRVYADLKVIDGNAEFSLKNISEQPLNISADELTERFIRGDVSRTTEGSGLGLSIAKSLTTIQGGDFQLYLDGDLFRVTIVFPIVKTVKSEDTNDDIK